MLGLSETRLVFHSEGLVFAAFLVAMVGAMVFWALLFHWVIRARAWGLAPLLALPPVLAVVGWLRARSSGAQEAELRRGGELKGEEAALAEPILPWWQVLVGMALACILVAVAVKARGASDVGTPVILLGMVVLSPATTAQAGLMIVLAGTAAVWVLFFYMRLFKYLGTLPMGVLLALRVLAIALLVILIFKPVLSYEERVEHRTDLYILVDSSRSMSVSDHPETPNRLALATTQVQQYLGRLQTAFNVKLYTFDTRAREAKAGQWPEPKGDATNITRSLKDVLAAARRADTSALILMSDGLHNAGGDVVQEVTAEGSPPIYPVGVGTDLTAQSGYQDISIENVRAPEESVVNNIAQITVDVASVGLADRTCQVELREGDKLLASESLRLAAKPGTQPVTLMVTPTETGRHMYKVNIPPDPAERRTENNSREVHLLVTDPKMRVLYIEGIVRPEYKPLKSLLETDPNVEVACLVQVKKGEFLQSGSMKGVALSGFPQTLEDMRRFDVFIVGDVDRSYFSGPQLENLKTAITEGRGLVMLGGYHSFGPGGYEETAMEEILPVTVGPRSIGQETTPFVLKLTPEGANHPIFFGTKDFFQYQQETPKEKLPYLKGCNVLLRAKPGASILAVHPERANPNGPLIVLAVQQYGRGRSAAFAADTTYQWYLPYRAMGRDSPYIKFWSQMVRWLANKEIKEHGTEPGVDLLIRKPFYNPGEKVMIRVKVRAEEGRATNYADVSGVLLGSGNERKSLAVPLAPGSVGVYETTLEPLDPGHYKLMVEARKDNKRLGLAETEFDVGRPNQEFDRLSIDRALLKQLATATGGEYYEPANFGDLVQNLRNRTIKEDIHREFGIHTVPGLFAILFGLFLAIVTGEWLLRKYCQLN